MFFALLLKRHRMTQVAAMLNTTAPMAQQEKKMTEKVTLVGAGEGLYKKWFNKYINHID